MRIRTVILFACLFLAAIGTAMADTPGNSSAFGKSLEEWMRLYTTWRMTGEQPAEAGDMAFVPDVNQVPEGDWTYDEDTNTWTYATEADLTFKTSQKFCAPLFYYYGDTYADGSVDPDDDPYWLGVLWDAKIRLVLDGKTIIDSEAKDFWKAWFDPTYFDPPFWYDDEHTQGMAFILGFGYVHEPLSKGKHTLVWSIHLEEFDPDWEEEYFITNEITYHIDVVK